MFTCGFVRSNVVFITLSGCSRGNGEGVGLPPAYSLFGKVIKGLEVADTMQGVATAPGDRPLEDVVINSVTITES